MHVSSHHEILQIILNSKYSKFIFPILTVGYKKYYQLVNTGNTVRSFIQ